MPDDGFVKQSIENGVGTISFYHPKKNSLPGSLLKKLAEAVTGMGEDENVKVVLLQSEGHSPFCAGASFDELLAVKDADGGTAFFMGFARLILAMKNCPKFVVVRAQGKAVGGGVGVICAADYVIATDRAATKLSEMALGFGPFVIGPVVERRIGAGPFAAMTVDTDWRDAQWAERHGMFAQVVSDIEALDEAISALTSRLAKSNPDAMARLKKVFWQDTEHWDDLLAERARMSGELVLSDFASNAIGAFRK